MTLKEILIDAAKNKRSWLDGVKCAEFFCRDNCHHAAVSIHRLAVSLGIRNSFVDGIADYLHYYPNLTKEARIYGKAFHFGKVNNPYADLEAAQQDHRS